mgnify:CR=1 FL=1
MERFIKDIAKRFIYGVELGTDLLLVRFSYNKAYLYFSASVERINPVISNLICSLVYAIMLGISITGSLITIKRIWKQH